MLKIATDNLQLTGVSKEKAHSSLCTFSLPKADLTFAECCSSEVAMIKQEPEMAQHQPIKFKLTNSYWLPKMLTSLRLARAGTSNHTGYKLKGTWTLICVNNTKLPGIFSINIDCKYVHVVTNLYYRKRYYFDQKQTEIYVYLCMTMVLNACFCCGYPMIQYPRHHFFGIIGHICLAFLFLLPIRNVEILY